MRCAAFELRLQHLLDERARPEDDVALLDHAADCPACREVLEVQAGVFDTVRDWSVSNLDIDLVERVLDCVSTEHVAAVESRSARARLWIAAHRNLLLRVLVAAAASAVIGVTALQWNTLNSTPSVETPAPREIAKTEKIAGPQNVAVAAPRSPSVSELARGLGHRVARGMVYVQRGGFDDSLQLPEPVAAGLRPLRDSMAAAIDALKRSLAPRNEQPVIRSSWHLPTTDAIV